MEVFRGNKEFTAVRLRMKIRLSHSEEDSESTEDDRIGSAGSEGSESADRDRSAAAEQEASGSAGQDLNTSATLQTTESEESDEEARRWVSRSSQSGMEIKPSVSSCNQY